MAKIVAEYAWMRSHAYLYVLILIIAQNQEIVLDMLVKE